VSLLCWLCAAWPAAGADTPMVVEVWPGKVPDEAGDLGPETVRMSPKLTRKEVEVTESTRMVTNVSKPTLTIYRPAKEKDSGTAVLICPGGGYWNLFWELGGEGGGTCVWNGEGGGGGPGGKRWGVPALPPKSGGPRPPDEPKGEPARRPIQDA